MSRPAFHVAVRSMVLVTLVLSALPTVNQPTNPQHLDTARALLAGSLWIEEPTSCHDLGEVDGRRYSPFPPLAALVAVPAVWASDRPHLWFNLAVMVAALMAVVLAGRLGDRVGGPPTGTWTAVALGLGSGFWMATALHDTYHSSHVLAVLAVVVALNLGIGPGRRPALAGLALGLGSLARQAVVLGAPSLVLITAGRVPDTRRRVAAVLAAVLLPLSLYFAINWLRFGSPFSTGYGAVAHGPSIAPDVEAHGVFSLVYVPRNLKVMLIGPPRVIAALPWIVPDPNGLSLLLVSPWLAFAVWSVLRPDRPRVRRISLACWMAAALMSVPHLAYVNTGYVQFGFRFALDWLPFLLLAAALGVRRAPRLPAVAVLVVAVAVNLWGLFALFTWERWSSML